MKSNAAPNENGCFLFPHVFLGPKSYCTDVNRAVITRYIMLLEDFYLISLKSSDKVEHRGRLCVTHWFFRGDFRARFYWLPVESFPTQTRLKLNALYHRHTRAQAAGGERLSQMFAHYGVTKLCSQQVKGKATSRHVSRPASHCVFWTRVTQYS